MIPRLNIFAQVVVSTFLVPVEEVTATNVLQHHFTYYHCDLKHQSFTAPWEKLHFTGCRMSIGCSFQILNITKNRIALSGFLLFFLMHDQLIMNATLSPWPFIDLLQGMWMEENFCLIHLSGSMCHMFGGGMQCSCRRYWKIWLSWWSF